MRYIFENGNSNKYQPKKTNNSKYTLWMNSILRRSKEIGKVELPICSVILDDSIVRGTTLRESILTMLNRLKPKKIIIVSSAPQILSLIHISEPTRPY